MQLKHYLNFRTWPKQALMLNLRMPGEKCLICNWCGNLFSIALTKDEEYSINCRNNIVAVIDR